MSGLGKPGHLRLWIALAILIAWIGLGSLNSQIRGDEAATRHAYASPGVDTVTVSDVLLSDSHYEPILHERLAREPAAPSVVPHSAIHPDTELIDPSLSISTKTEPSNRDVAMERRLARFLQGEDIDAEEMGSQNDQRETSGGFDPAMVARGQAAFEEGCTLCHDAERSTSKRKNLAGWFATVRRMAAKAGAEILDEDIEPIAVYLTSLNPDATPPAEGDGAADLAAAAAAQPFSAYATVSTAWRGGNDVLENAGFFPEIWVGADWNNESPLSAHVAACVTCHTEGNEGSRIEIAQGTLRLDLSKWCKWGSHGPSAFVEAGRVIVPFGAFTAKSQPGAFRTVTKPLIYNMGMNVNRPDLGPPVLPLPYSDEGFLANASVPLWHEWSTTFDFYVVNGLRGNLTGINFFQSRDYVDNNFEPAVGGRWTVGTSSLRFGSSLMSGRFNDLADAGPAAIPLFYQVVGADVSYRWEDNFRLQFEYALRQNNRINFAPTAERIEEDIDGFYVESELKICEKPKVGVVARYGEQSFDSVLPPSGSLLTASRFAVRRFTYGLTWTLAGGSLFMINHEHWSMPAELPNVDVIGLRWVGAF